MKEKKITIKPFINKNLAPLEHSDKFPLYFQITYQRKNTQVKSHFSIFLDSIEGVRGEELALMNFEIDILHKTVVVERNKIGKSFTLHGIKERYELNILSLESVFESHLKKKLLKAIKYCNSEFIPIIKFDGFEVTFSLLLKASKLLIDNFMKSIPNDFKEEIEAYQNFQLVKKTKIQKSIYECVLDWQTAEYQAELKSLFIEFYKDRTSQAEKTIAILNDIVDERLKFL